MMGIGLFTEDEAKYDPTFVGNFAEINIIPELKRIPGVGLASLYGGRKDYSMRVRLSPSKMSDYQVSRNEVMKAITIVAFRGWEFNRDSLMMMPSMVYVSKTQQQDWYNFRETFAKEKDLRGVRCNYLVSFTNKASWYWPALIKRTLL